MDAVDFVRNYIWMCATVDDCEQCPCYKTGFCTVPVKLRTREIAKDVVQSVEEWATAQPVKTRQSEFLKMFPNAFVEDDGCLSSLPCDVDITVKGSCTKKTCRNCRHDYWLQEGE